MKTTVASTLEKTPTEPRRAFNDQLLLFVSRKGRYELVIVAYGPCKWFVQRGRLSRFSKHIWYLFAAKIEKISAIC